MHIIDAYAYMYANHCLPFAKALLKPTKNLSLFMYKKII